MLKELSNFKPRVVNIPDEYFKGGSEGHPDPSGEPGENGIVYLERYRRNRTLLFCLFLILFMLSCESVKYIPVENVKTEKEYVDRWNRDSVCIRDSVFVLVKGDTVFKDRYRIVYKDRYSRDTVYVSKVDTVQVAYPVEVPVKHVPRGMWWVVIALAILGLPSILKIITKLKGFKI